MSSHHLLLTPVSLRREEPVGEAALIWARVRERRERWEKPMVEVPENVIPGRGRREVSREEKVEIAGLLEDGWTVFAVAKQTGWEWHTIRKVRDEMRGKS